MSAQPFTGTYTTQPPTEPVVLTLEATPEGAVGGRMAGSGATFEVQAVVEAGGLRGTLADARTGLRLSLAAQLEGDLLQLTLYPVNPWGQPDHASGQTLVLQRQPAGAKEIAGAPSPAPAAPAREVVINRQRLSTERLHALESLYRTHVPDGRYWYDARCGAWGVEGGPTAGFLPPNLDLPGPMPPDVSGGGTGVFINGREVHVQDQMALVRLFGMAPPGRYWLDALGNLGVEGGPALVNLMQATQQAGGGGGLVSGMGGTVGVHPDGGVGFFARNSDGSITSWNN
jgi:hypothetical protein